MNGDMQDLMEEIEKTMVRLRRGEIVILLKPKRLQGFYRSFKQR